MTGPALPHGRVLAEAGVADGDAGQVAAGMAAVTDQWNLEQAATASVTAHEAQGARRPALRAGGGVVCRETGRGVRPALNLAACDYY